MKQHSTSTRAILRTLPLLLAAALFTACGGGTAEPAGEEGHDEHGEDHGPEVALSADQIKAIGLITGTMEKRGLKTSLKANGKLVRCV